MPALRGRKVGEPFNSTESALLDVLCGGDDRQSGIARAQLATATWGGYEFDECDCFLIQSDSDAGHPLIEHDGGPFSFADVCRGGEALGLLELWVVDGRLHSVDYMPYGDHSTLPAMSDFEVTLIER